MRNPAFLLLPLLAAACSDLSDPPRPLDHPVHVLAIADAHAITVNDADVMDAGTIAIAGEPIVHATTTAGSGSGSDAPPAIPDLPIATTAAIGANHACIVSRGDVYCWGDNVHGALGAHRACAAGSTTCPLDPEIMPTLPKVSAIAAGDDVTCAIAVDDGRVYCWGSALDGRLGGSFVSALGTPEPVALPDPIVRLTIQNDRVCAIDTKQLAWCWGGGFGPAPVRQDLVGVVDLAVGAHHTCAISSRGLECWGEDRNGESGDIAAARACGTEAATCVVGHTAIALDATRVVVGERHSCALTHDGFVRCWGSNEVGQLGRPDSFLVGDVGVAIGDAIDLASSYAKTCAVTSDHTGWCWGDYHGSGPR